MKTMTMRSEWAALIVWAVCMAAMLGVAKGCAAGGNGQRSNGHMAKSERPMPGTVRKSASLDTWTPGHLDTSAPQVKPNGRPKDDPTNNYPADSEHPWWEFQSSHGHMVKEMPLITLPASAWGESWSARPVLARQAPRIQSRTAAAMPMTIGEAAVEEWTRLREGQR